MEKAKEKLDFFTNQSNELRCLVGVTKYYIYSLYYRNNIKQISELQTEYPHPRWGIVQKVPIIPHLNFLIFNFLLVPKNSNY
jgi:hypothetical protein